MAEALVRAAEVGKDGIDPEGDYEVDEKQRSCTLTDEGFAKAEQTNVQDLFDPQDPGPITSPMPSRPRTCSSRTSTTSSAMAKQ